jgi:membrane-bound ClpP family serine protease
VVAEMHAPSVVLGGAGSAALLAGAFVMVAGLGGGVIVAIPVALVLAVVACAWMVAVIRTASRSRGTRSLAGTAAMCGRVGVVRRWSESAGQVFVDGALWRARHEWLDAEEGALHEGESIVVERVSGLTLSVRRAEEWELIG